jgi:hypothetical protein
MRIVEGTLLTALLFSVPPVFAQADRPANEPRLKFRSGPPCMCNDGLGERAIREAEQRNKQHEWARARPAPKLPQPETTRGE